MTDRNMKSTSGPEVTDVVDSIDPMKVVLATLRRDHGIFRSDQGLMVQSGETERMLIARFSVRGARTPNGAYAGVVLSAGKADSQRSCLAPMSAVRDPKALAEYFDKIGVLAPISLPDLRLLTTYVDAIARISWKTVLEREGLHQIGQSEAAEFVAVLGHDVIGKDVDRFIAMPSGESHYARRGTIRNWKRDFEKLLPQNPLLITSACFGLAVPLGELLNLRPLMGLLLAGASSTGKTTLARFVMSLHRKPGEPYQWSSTANGIEALARDHTDLPLVLDEIGAGSIRQTLETIYRVSGGVTKTRATASGQLQPADKLRCAVFATGEVTLSQQAQGAAVRVRAGHDVRLPTIWVDERFGVYSDIGNATDGAAFAARVARAMSENYGVALPALLRSILLDPETTHKEVERLRPKVKKTLLGEEDETKMTAAEKRVVAGFANMALAGELATHLDILPLQPGAASKAIAKVFKKWLDRWRLSEHEPSTAPRHAICEYLKQNTHRFTPLKEWRQPRANSLGYLSQSEKRGKLFLFFPTMFEQIASGHGVDACIKSLREADLLITDMKGRKLIVRLPGSEERMSFYAIRYEIIFDGSAESA